MKTGMFTCGHQRLPIEHAFRDASELGYDGIEIWGGRPLSLIHISEPTRP